METSTMRLWFLNVLLAYCGVVSACDESPSSSSVEDVVYNTINPGSSELDLELQQQYGCAYAFAMLLSKHGYEDMKLVSGSMPATPQDAAGQPVKGKVLIGFVLNVDGVPVDPVVLRSQHPRLAEIALRHISGLRYQPSKFNGKSVRSLGTQFYNFK